MCCSVELVQPLTALEIACRPLPVGHAVLISDTDSQAWTVIVIDANRYAHWLPPSREQLALTLTTASGARAGGRASRDTSQGTTLRLVGLGALLQGLRGEAGEAGAMPGSAA